ncbi:MAG: hypothetical protein HYV07_07760 [Deltaproteobacteria bacterium]|nr:hypothetical protein [Deltaproteobacteria bacterium]
MKSSIDHQFVKYLPDSLEPGILYISVEYATAAHLCCCGCGEQVVTPFSPTDWKMTFDGESISLWPSIGNWKFACRSHYIIRSGKIIGVETWNEDRVESAVSADRAAKSRYYSPQRTISDEEILADSVEEQESKPEPGVRQATDPGSLVAGLRRALGRLRFLR